MSTARTINHGGEVVVAHVPTMMVGIHRGVNVTWAEQSHARSRQLQHEYAQYQGNTTPQQHAIRAMQFAYLSEASRFALNSVPGFHSGHAFVSATE
jgi:hypothetical protein